MINGFSVIKLDQFFKNKDSVIEHCHVFPAPTMVEAHLGTDENSPEAYIDWTY